MDDERGHASSHRAMRLAEKMRDKEYRDGYVEAHARRFLALQMRKLRGEMSQAEFAALLDKKQTVISRLEDPAYTGWSLRTIFEVSRKLNVAAVVRFVDFSTFLKFTGDQSEVAQKPSPYDQTTVEDDAGDAEESADDVYASLVGELNDEVAPFMPPTTLPTWNFPTGYRQGYTAPMMVVGAFGLGYPVPQGPLFPGSIVYGSPTANEQRWVSRAIRGPRMTQLLTVIAKQQAKIANLEAEVAHLKALQDRLSAELLTRPITDQPTRESGGALPMHAVAVRSKQSFGVLS